MNIKNYFLNIGSSMPNVMAPFAAGSATTIADFWDCFVEPRLPNPQIFIGLYDLLRQYVDDADAVLAIRCYGNWESYKVKDDYTLRRGFYNLTDKGYSFFYTDNFYAAYFAKMAVDGYVPVYQEFKKHMISREFPARFGRSTQAERDRMAYSIDGKKGKDPGFARNGYKIAHVIDSGKGIHDLAGNHLLTIGDVCGTYCARGEYSDWGVHNDDWGEFFARDLVMDPSAKAFLIAHFLRFVCPMNYIFTPGKNHHVLGVKVRSNDIAECEELQQYAMLRFHERFGTIYEDYLNRLLLPPSLNLSNLPSINQLADKVINIQYGKNMKTTTPKSSSPGSSKGSTPKTTTSSKINSRSILSKLKSMQLAGSFKQKVTKLTDVDAFESYLKRNSAIKTDVSREEYLYSLETSKFNKLLKNHKHKSDIYNCNDLNILIDVLDDLVNKVGNSDVNDALSVGNTACRSALCYFLKHLLSINGIII